MDILVGWLADRSNYQRWRSGNAVVETDHQQRIPKKILLEEILTKMRQAGIHHRLPKDVASKISTLQSNYRAACEWMNTEARRLRKAGVSEHTIHEEVVKHFAYWDALNPSFGHYRCSSSSGPMAISSLMDQQQQQQQQQQEEQQSNHSDDDQVDELDEDDEYQEPYHGDGNHRNARILNHQHTTQQKKRRRRMYQDEDMNENDNSRITKRRNSTSSSSNSSAASNDLLRILNHTCRPTPSSSSNNTVLSTSSSTAHHHHPSASSVDSVLADSFIEINREKEPITRKRSSSNNNNHHQHVLRFLHGKQAEQEQLLIEKESRIRAKAELVKHLMKAGFSEEEITEQLSQL
ncbi:hypothetical protein O0I10_006580 [Lichtheimia ornata]|uniref:Uncharacterized protein n=1 Tax=Lichtheimia ornata TaxID=688661 RepID=A0AAD7V3Y3_9FUNG|nr:uncharacterized protein O0I10_006580 [Lichtheimia ornata]KAJ8657765.1 hypothetical protein O0I10_006580 [Lichtheimia ornata]